MESVKLLRSSFRSGLTRNMEFRKNQLKSLFKMIDDHENDICLALKKDMNKNETEAKMTELLIVKQEISYLLKNMDKWLHNTKVPKTFLTIMDSTYIQKQPYGVALCVGAWNYPVQLLLAPLAGLIASGNCVLLKPSDIATNTEALMANIIPKYLAKEVCIVELANAEKMNEILKERFDLIMYTGSSNVGKIIMEAASKHLTPCVLECGGKCPTYVDESVDMKMAVRRILWGKFVNSGQTCVAPDYVLLHKSVKSEFIETSIKLIEEFFTKDPLESPDYGRIINARHYNRIMKLVESSKGTVVTGGKGDESKLFIPPTIVLLDSLDDSLMGEEIFGPILSVFTVNSADEAVNIINEREKPLAVYSFSSNKNIWHKLEQETTSGGYLVNDVIVHCGVMGLPFGGVGLSGMGQYHGQASIDYFSHSRAVLNKDTNEFVDKLFRYPPYNASKLSWTEWGLKSDDRDKARYCNIL